jgi:ribosomal protein S18 acetylase RimI-like enzyme
MGAPETARFFISRKEIVVTVHMPAALTLRQADAFDAAALAELRVAGLIELGLLAPHAAAAFDPRARREYWTLLREEKLTAWVLVAGGRLAGCACMLFWDRLPYPETSVHAELCGVYVAPRYRRQGIARELVSEAVASAHARGVRRIVLSPTPLTREFYRTLGFTESGQMRM